MKQTIGDMFPDLAKNLGIDLEQARSLEQDTASWNGRVLIVIIRPPSQGKDQPIAYLPPNYQAYGIIDRDHAHRVRPGEAWVVEAYTRGFARILLPLVKVSLSDVINIRPEMLEELAVALKEVDPGLAAEVMERTAAKDHGQLEAEMLQLQREREALSNQLSSAREEQGALTRRISELEILRERPAAVPAQEGSQHREDDPRGVGLLAPPALGREGPIKLVRRHGEILEGDGLRHTGYSTFFTPDLARVVLQPSREGEPCLGGAVRVPGIARADPTPAPREYEAVWDERAGGYILDLS